MSDWQFRSEEGDDAERTFAAWRAIAIEVHETALILPLAPVFKLDFPEEVQPVREAAKRGDVVGDCGTMAHRSPEGDWSVFFDIQWTYPAARLTLMVSVAEHRALLQMMMTANNGMIFLAPRGPLDVDKALCVEDVPMDVISTVLDLA